MQISTLLKQRLATALSKLTDDTDELAQMVRTTQDPRFGDYQANCAMPLKQRLGQPPRQIAEQIIEHLDVGDICEPPEIAGPGFINFRLRQDWLAKSTTALLSDDRLGVDAPASPRTLLIDFSSPNVAKPMHVGHIRSTVIGDALTRTFRFLGHNVITDNHLGDWGTQFGMIIYGYKHFVDQAAFEAGPVAELVRLYRIVNSLIDYHNAVAELSHAQASATLLRKEADAAAEMAQEMAAKPQAKKLKKAADSAARKATAAAAQVRSLQAKIDAVEADPQLAGRAAEHPGIANAVLTETAKLHQGDAENRQLWDRFLPHCKDEINRVYQRLNIEFDHTLGESFYHPMLADVVDELKQAGLARDSEGAVCVFLPQFDAPMIVQKKDGAFLYGTTDLATLKYRDEQFKPDEILYVVDSRQSDHFEKLFAIAPQMGLGHITLRHVNFGTVLGEDGKPLKTRSGANAGLEGLLDDAVAAAMDAVCDPQRTAKLDPPLSETERQRIASVIGHGAIKYADLAHHRTSDYRFSLKKMVALEGNTIAYLQYAYARTQGILRVGGSSEQAVCEAAAEIQPIEPAERALCVALLRFPEALQQVADDYAPSALVDYLYDTARKYMVFNDNCHVWKAEDEQTKASRLSLVVATNRIIRGGLSLLGIEVVDRM
ncbi:arginine--tRNA ligase [Roseimaritima ulvae]|uniref:Arginine--tRNA ligase n=1 Tax=Roseimaritima ulvae TaxID=980254 RepID=A0A5B9QN61_9BACT|nr:arginine--tRNA ligase [Roseimaritima ulvae]QEG40394.1 Arginine--tRNA ligase [Roseimaritima ulvae]